jgi:hypothetical protein
LGEKAFALISDAFGKGRASSCSHLSPSTKEGNNPTKTWKL